MEMSALYNVIGTGYDETRGAEPRITARLDVHLKPEPQKIYVDVACGTGNYTVSLTSQEVFWIGIDQSERMIIRAKRKSEKILWCHGDVRALPLVDTIAGGALCVLSIHHFEDLASSFAEVYRIINQGRFVLFTTIPEQMQGYWLNHYFPDTMARAIEQMPSFHTVKSALIGAGFRDIRNEPFDVPPDPKDLFLYCGKHQPGFYLEEKIRKGISTFASLADQSEVEQGVSRLRSDIASGKIEEVMNDYTHSDGDYIFIVACKKSV